MVVFFENKKKDCAVVVLPVLYIVGMWRGPRHSLQHVRGMQRVRRKCVRMFVRQRPDLRRARVHEHNSRYYLPVLLCESRSGVLWHCMRSLSVRDARRTDTERVCECFAGQFLGISL